VVHFVYEPKSPVPGSKDRGLWTLDHAQADALERMRRLFDQSRWDLVQTENGEITQVWQQIESVAKSLETAAGRVGTSNSDSLRELAKDLRVYALWL